MKPVRLALAISLLCAGTATADVVGSKHDLSSAGPGAKTTTAEVCVFCHTPHQTTAAGGQAPLWNHTLSSTATYGVYDSATSPTMNAAPTELGGAVAGSAMVSNLCLSCHDGTVGVHSLYNPPNGPALTLTAGGNVSAAGLMTGTPNMGTDLTDDHPVNFAYNAALATADGELATPTSANFVDAGSTVPLFSTTVQCASCHDPHKTTFTPFLVKSNSSSALCTTCHVK